MVWWRTTQHSGGIAYRGGVDGSKLEWRRRAYSRSDRPFSADPREREPARAP